MVMSSNDSINARIRWSKEHLNELERLFPEDISTLNTNELLFNAGSRRVVAHVRERIKQQEFRASDKGDTFTR